MKKKHNPSCLQLHRLFALLIFLSLHLMISGSLKAQGPMSFIGDRENIGLYGGPADDLAFVYPNQRLFGAVNSAGVLFYSDDLCTSWTPAFPIDSMEFQLGMRGWGGSARRVVTNIRGWVAVQTEFPEGDLSASVVSYNMGSSNSFHTAMDPWLLKQLTGHYHQVTATGLSEHFLYTALGPFLTRTNDTLPFGPQQVVARVDTLPWIFPEPVIRSIAVANHPSGFPVFLCVEPMSGGTDGLLLKYDGTVFTDITSLPVGSTPVKIFTHPGQITGDTLFLSINQFPGNMIQVYRSLNGGMLWVDITPVGGTDYHLADADFSPDWQTMMP
ncbi:MAG: hypothetical protein JW861_05410, partial [Bacteroidales bacterium]|nr:hypothetical protein [Bacteroidales bacterium]